MGSYDTGECYITPRRSEPRDVAPRRVQPPVPTPEPEETTDYEDNIGDRARDAVQNYVPPTGYDPNLKTIVALGGGLTPDRIVQPVPDDVRDGTLMDVVKYLMGDEVATRTEDRAVVEAVQARMAAPDYRVIVNNTLNLGNDKMTRPLIQYLQQKEQQGEDGALKYNFTDLAIVSQDEGGMRYRPRLEQRLYR